MNSSGHTSHKEKKKKQLEIANNTVNQQKKIASPFYVRLMRHDWHIKVKGRIRQQGWNDD